MSEYRIKGETLTGIADAIRKKTGGTEPIPVPDMAAQIEGISGGGGGSSADVCYVTFMSHDGTVELGKKAVAVGDDCADPIARGVFDRPTRESDAQYDYDHAGWSKNPDNVLDDTALDAVTEDRVVYAVYAATVRDYTINFYDGGTLLSSQTLAYGATPTASDPQKNGYSFEGWEPEIVAVTGNATYTAKWAEAITFAGGAWEDIIRIAEAGEAQKYFSLGDTKTFEYKLSTAETAATFTTTVMIVGFECDDLADGTGKAAMSLLVVQDGISQMFNAYNTAFDNGWPTCALRTKLNGTILNTFNEVVKNAVKLVTKKSYIYTGEIKTSDDSVWVPSCGEFGAGKTASSANYTIENEGDKYPGISVDIFSGSLLDDNGLLNCATRSMGASRQGCSKCITTNTSPETIIYTSTTAYNVSLRTTFGFCI